MTAACIEHLTELICGRAGKITSAWLILLLTTPIAPPYIGLRASRQPISEADAYALLEALSSSEASVTCRS
jgi:hypothetical protein